MIWPRWHGESDHKLPPCHMTLCPEPLLFFLDLVINLSLSYFLIHRCTIASSPRQSCCFIIFIAWSIYNYLWAQAHNFTFSPVILGLTFISQTSLPVDLLAGSVNGTCRLEVGRQDEWRYSLFPHFLLAPPSSKGGPWLHFLQLSWHQLPHPRVLSIMPAHQP